RWSSSRLRPTPRPSFKRSVSCSTRKIFWRNSESSSRPAASPVTGPRLPTSARLRASYSIRLSLPRRPRLGADQFEETSVQTPAHYAARYEKLTIPSLDGSADLATEIAVDKYLLGVRTGGYDERVRLEQKIQKDLAIRRKTDKSAKITIRVNTPDGIAERSF